MADDATRPRLLIADDDRAVLGALTAQLHERFEVVGAAEDAQQAVELARSAQPDVALIDVQMPAGGGLHATRGIREVSPGTAVVILSVDESESSVMEFLGAGAISYLRKGTSAAEITTVLRDSISAHQALASGDASNTTTGES